MKKTEETKTLSLRREALKELSVDDLGHVVGGTTAGSNSRTGMAQ